MSDHLRFLRTGLVVLLCAVVLPAPAADAQGTAKGTVQGTTGLRYWLPVDVAVVDALVATTTKTEIEVVTAKDAKTGSDRYVLQPVSRTDVERTGTLAIRTLADLTSEPSVIDIAPGRLRDTSIGVEVSPGGLLRSVSPSSIGRAGDVIQAVARFVGTAASFASGIPILPVSLSARAQPLLEGTAITVCDPFAAPFATQPIRVRALVAASEEGCVLMVEVLDRQAALKSHEKTRLTLELAIDSAAETELPNLKARLASVKGAIKATQAEIEARQVRFGALLEAFAREKKLGTQSRTERFATVIKLGDLTDSVTTLPAESPARQFFKASGILLTGSRVGTSAAAGTIPKQKSKTVRIAFRQSEPWRFRLEASQQPVPDATALTLLNDVVTDVIAPGTASRVVDFESSAFAERKLAITFDDRGRPIRLERTGTSAGAALATAVADASRAARDEYAAGLSKLVDIQTSQQKLQLAPISAQIDELKRKKELLDARIAVEGATGSFDTLVQQQQLQAELGLLQATQAQATAAGTADQRIEIESWKLQLEQLKTQVDILKAQQELARLRQP